MSRHDPGGATATGVGFNQIYDPDFHFGWFFSAKFAKSSLFAYPCGRTLSVGLGPTGVKPARPLGGYSYGTIGQRLVQRLKVLTCRAQAGESSRGSRSQVGRKGPLEVTFVGVVLYSVVA